MGRYELNISSYKLQKFKTNATGELQFPEIISTTSRLWVYDNALSDDWQGADFIAQHINGEIFLKVQLKSRLSFQKKYVGKDIQIAFVSNGTWYLFPHDELLEKAKRETNIENTKSWIVKGGYHYPYLSKQLLLLLDPYKILSVN